MLFPHLLLFPYQPAYDSASSASKLYKTQGKLPQRDTILLFPLLLLPLPHRLLSSPFSACDKSKCVPQHWLHIVGVQLKTNSMSSTGRFMSILQCEKNAPLVHFFAMWLEKKREHGLLEKDTHGHVDFSTFKTSVLPPSGLKATLVGHQV